MEHIVHHAPDGSINSLFDYAYDVLGRRTGMATLDGSWMYGYDLTGQLIRAVFVSSNPSIPNQDLAYEYDAMGNRVRTVVNGITTDYAANNLNEYTAAGNVTFRYDKDGNLIEQAGADGTIRFSYDAKNRLVRVKSPQVTMTYEYDAFGNRLAVVENGHRTEFLLDPTDLVNVIGAYDETGARVVSYVHGVGLEMAGGIPSTQYFDFDALGSTAGVSDVSGAYVSTYAYDPFGGGIHRYEANPNPFEFIGQWGVMSDSNAIDHMRARYYSPSLGRFTAVDPLGLNGGQFNPYTYVGNAPSNWSDPSGLIFLPPIVYGAAIASAYYLPHLAVAYCLPQTQIGVGIINSAINAGTGGVVEGPLPVCNPFYATVGNLTFELGKLGIETARGVAAIFASKDPNEKLGAAGAGVEGYVSAGAAIPYRINFENLGTGSQPMPSQPATAPAQRVMITDQLSGQLDWATFSFTEAGFGDNSIFISSGAKYHFATVPMEFNDETFDVEVELMFDAGTGRVRAVFQAIDPLTSLPPSILTGFLPPEDGTGRGKGYIAFTVNPKADVLSGTEIRNVALISFDGQTIIATNQVDPEDSSKGIDPAKEALNTIDAAGPVSSVRSLPATTQTADFTVEWSGTDESGGSGVVAYDIYVSDNSGPFKLWLANTAQTSATYTGLDGHTYAFYSVAKDGVGHVEAVPEFPDTQTTLAISAPPVADAGGPYTVLYGGTVLLDGSLSMDEDQEPSTLTYLWDLDEDGIFGEVGPTAAHGNETGSRPTFVGGQLSAAASVDIFLQVTDAGGLSSVAQTSINVVKAEATIALTGSTVTYDGESHAIEGQARGVYGEVLTPVVVTYDGSPNPPTNAGTYSVLAFFEGNSNYNAAANTTTLTIDKAEPSLSVTGGTIGFDGQPHAATASAIGVNGESLTPVTITYNGSSDVPGDVGTYNVVASFAGDTNYKPASATTTLTIKVPQPPVLQPIGDQTIVHNTGALSITLQATDPDNDGLTLHVEILPLNSLAYELDQVHNFRHDNRRWDTATVKWLQGRDQWYQLTSDGKLYDWPAGKLMAHLGNAYFEDTSLLVNVPVPFAPRSLAYELDLVHNFRHDVRRWDTATVKWLEGRDLWYKLTADGKLYDWPTGKLMADLGQAYFDDTSLLVDVPLPLGPRSLAYELDLVHNFRRSSLRVETATVKWLEGRDGLYKLTAEGKLYDWPSGRLMADVGRDYFNNPSLLIDVPLPADPRSLVYELDRVHNFRHDDRHWDTATVKWLEGRDQWYKLTSDGKLYDWPTGKLMANLGRAYFDDTSLLIDVAELEGPRSLAYELDLVHNFRHDDRRYDTATVKWLQGRDQWYKLTSDGKLYDWPTGKLMANLGRPYFDDTSLLIDVAEPQGPRSLAYELDLVHNFRHDDRRYDTATVKWLQGRDQWYKLTSDGNLYDWPTGKLMAELGTAYFHDTSLLIDVAAPQIPKVTVVLHGNQLQLIPPADYLGTFRVRVIASDGRFEIIEYFDVRVV